MTRDEAVTIIQQELGWRNDKATEIITAMKNAQVKFERAPELPWFLRTEVSNISTSDGEERVPLPDDFLREWEEDAIYYYNGAAAEVEDVWKPLLKAELEWLRATYPGEGSPQAYAFDGNYYRVFPTPDGVYTLKQIFYKADTVLTADIENDWLKYSPDVLIGEAGFRMSMPFRDTDGIAWFGDLRDKSYRQLLVDTEALKHEGRRYIMGGEN